MDLSVKNSFFSLAFGQVSALAQNNEAALSVEPAHVQQRLLPESASSIPASTITELSRYSVSSVANYRDVTSRFVELAKTIVADTTPEFLDCIDVDCWLNMSQALQFSGINTLEKAREMDLRVCPPCPVLHTWAALHGTTVFNGENNPEALAGLNYVQRIKQEATDLERFGIPVIVVYSRKGLSQEQVDSMRADFADHGNIVCLGFESDLDMQLPTRLQMHDRETVTVQFMDSLRVAVSQNIEQLLNVSTQVARSYGKQGLVSRIETLGYQNIFYSDIDNHWMGKPPWLLASGGLFTQPVLSSYLPFFDEQVYDLSHLTSSDRDLLQMHRTYFMDMPHFRRGNDRWDRAAAERACQYILSGDAEKNHRYLYQKIHGMPYQADDLQDLSSLWSGDNGCCYVSADRAELFLARVTDYPCIINLHRNPALYLNRSVIGANLDEYFREAHTLIGVQMLRYYSLGHDGSWFNKLSIVQ